MGKAAVTKPLGFGETDLHKAISSGCLARQKEYGHPDTQMEGLATYDSVDDLSLLYNSSSERYSCDSNPSVPYYFFFCQRILQGSLSKPPCSFSLALGSVLVEGISQHFALSMCGHQSSGQRLVSTGHQDGRQKLRSFDQSPWRPTLAWQ